MWKKDEKSSRTEGNERNTRPHVGEKKQKTLEEQNGKKKIQDHV